MSVSDSAAFMHGLILFGHGARDPRWAEPFERLATLTRAGNAPVTLAYLELMTPSLGEAVTEQVSAGCTRITIVPVFFGRGAHLRRDLPALLDACRAAHPTIEIRLATAVGEEESVLQAIAAFCLRARDT
ncbi:sirohydrochlorin chelatase [Chitinasiproducens palmae]|uniref:Sirohydrochlorin cobaltochelatase n=1 Tax=Chitinasiproducens palmae TaxID=1770053 RepID=A0A1H2PN19_9BURK|nr:CbiX/SirB N-terminal domain-containing protein [Chitinasiproducens palmae]SDV48018.1 sirohydrochlorin cobaltochelatase [Chitinasiproducens palmae]